MTSFRKCPVSRQRRSSIVTVIPPFKGGGGNWINLSARLQETMAVTCLRAKPWCLNLVMLAHLRPMLELLLFLTLLWFESRRGVSLRLALLLRLALRLDARCGVIVRIAMRTPPLRVISVRVARLQAEQRQQMRVQSRSSDQLHAVVQRKNRRVKVLQFVLQIEDELLPAQTVETVDVQEGA
ncbi:hypothetical protein EYF80_035095 [Liparis tanakae]|uniref:Uncharacterized protein n=1 Tax=Liparis tanakae TaxID=230148 RepID=A0A4Z2GPR8_9TELE|nr:hypothetical protein EYF80_035095 [Liparis tanakae]